MKAHRLLKRWPPDHAAPPAYTRLDDCSASNFLCVKHSADAFFEASEAKNLRMIAGKVLMDRNCPAFLRDTTQSGHDDSAELITRWHGRSRQMYALTPRFAPTSTVEQLEACAELARRHPDVFV